MIERESANGWAALFWSAFGHSANPMALLRSDRVLVAINDAFVEDFGYQPAEAIGRSTDLLVAPAWRRRIELDWARLQRTGRLTGERELVRADGRHVHVQFAAHGEQVTGRQLILCVVLDVRLRPMQLTLTTRAQAKPLTPRELEIVGKIAMGRRWREIASDLFITQSTVKTHVRNAMRKLGARSQAQLVAITLATGILDPARVRGDPSS
ncbi:MAG: PAS domain S-box protein [Solirubrobacterales bacterium]|nr:PAS domain S-box protein [Solirubrobacterales bacterium]